MKSIIAFVKDRAKGPCSCQYNMGRLSIGWDPVTNESKHDYDRGPRTHYCLRCQARAALDADGIEYDKDDARNWAQFVTDHPGVKFNVDAAPSLTQEGSTVTFSERTLGLDGIKCG
jgi:hypothetical protein